MPVCPECENELDVDLEEVDEGDVIVCNECGTQFEVVATDPLELSKVDEGEGRYDDGGDERQDEDDE